MTKIILLLAGLTVVAGCDAEMSVRISGTNRFENVITNDLPPPLPPGFIVISNGIGEYGFAFNSKAAGDSLGTYRPCLFCKSDIKIDGTTYYIWNDKYKTPSLATNAAFGLISEYGVWQKQQETDRQATNWNQVNR